MFSKFLFIMSLVSSSTMTFANMEEAALQETCSVETCSATEFSLLTVPLVGMMFAVKSTVENYYPADAGAYHPRPYSVFLLMTTMSLIPSANRLCEETEAIKNLLLSDTQEALATLYLPFIKSLPASLLFTSFVYFQIRKSGLPTAPTFYFPIQHNPGHNVLTAPAA